MFFSNGVFSPHSLSVEHGDQVILVHTATGDGATEEMCISEFVSRISHGEGLYAKDWHFFQFPNTNEMYQVPSVFIDDWLNVYWQRMKKNADDYRFLYIGGEDTVTKVHHDVLFSYSWSLNLHGRKKWTLWRPEETRLLRASNTTTAPVHTTTNTITGALTASGGVSTVVCSITSISDNEEFVQDARPGQYDPAVFSGVAQTHPLSVVQEEGEAIFVPAGWYHMVENLGDSNYTAACEECRKNLDKKPQHDHKNITVSVNHNWINGFNVYKAWKFLVKEFNNTRQEMWDFLDIHERENHVAHDSTSRDGGGSRLWNNREGLGMSLQEWHIHCELTLKINAGLGYKEFLEMIISRVLCLCRIHFKTAQPNDPVKLLLFWERYAPIISKAMPTEPQTVDLEVYEKLAHHTVHVPPPSPCESLMQRSGEWKINEKRVNITNISLEELVADKALSFPLSSLEYSMIEVFRIVLEIKNSSHLRKYLKEVYASNSNSNSNLNERTDDSAQHSHGDIETCLNNVEELLQAILLHNYNSHNS